MHDIFSEVSKLALQRGRVRRLRDMTGAPSRIAAACTAPPQVPSAQTRVQFAHNVVCNDSCLIVLPRVVQVGARNLNAQDALPAFSCRVRMRPGHCRQRSSALASQTLPLKHINRWVQRYQSLGGGARRTRPKLLLSASFGGPAAAAPPPPALAAAAAAAAERSARRPSPPGSSDRARLRAGTAATAPPGAGTAAAAMTASCGPDGSHRLR